MLYLVVVWGVVALGIWAPGGGAGILMVLGVTPNANAWRSGAQVVLASAAARRGRAGGVCGLDPSGARVFMAAGDELVRVRIVDG